MERLSEEEIHQQLIGLPEWERLDEKWIERKYRFQDYLNGIRFVDKAAEYAENKKHHPIISIEYKKVKLKLSSWQAKGLTKLDFEMSKYYDELYENADK
jgi:4a-hydroxytetrahydrobiopterin dehydratase